MKIELRNINKSYVNGKNQTVALTDINLTINEGDQVIIVGESGAGKSTLLNIIGLIDADFTGEYEVNGQNVTKLSKKDIRRFHNISVGLIFQEYALIEDETVFNNVKIPLLYSKVRRREFKARVQEILELVELGKVMKKKVSMLSGGERQRVAIARALVNRPDVILADEPTGSLNERLSNQVMDILYSYADETKILIIVTHELERIRRANQRIVTIDEGKVIDQ